MLIRSFLTYLSWRLNKASVPSFCFYGRYSSLLNIFLAVFAPVWLCLSSSREPRTVSNTQNVVAPVSDREIVTSLDLLAVLLMQPKMLLAEDLKDVLLSYIQLVVYQDSSFFSSELLSSSFFSFLGGRGGESGKVCLQEFFLLYFKTFNTFFTVFSSLLTSTLYFFFQNSS